MYVLYFLYSFINAMDTGNAFHILATMDIAVNVGLQFSLQDLIVIPSGTFLEVGLLHHMVVLLFVLAKPIYCFHRGCTNLHSQKQYTSILFSQYPLPVIFPLFTCTCPNRCESTNSLWF